MSSLGSLLGGGKAESNDSLKYVAPREPKKGGSKSKTPVKAAATQENTQPAQTQQASPQPQTSKVLASAAIRLFMLNPQTNGYDAVGGGNPLGCVIMGMGMSYQILVYDGQKVPQATAPITSSFQYNLRDLYVSFSDGAGHNFSALFDTVEILTSFVRSVMAVVCHMNCHSPDAPQGTVKGHIPPTSADAESGGAPLTAGASAGCRFKAWEVCENDYDNPAEVFASPPFLESSDITKIKVGGGEDPVGGMGAALVGLSKNDKVIIGVPTGTAYTDCSGDLSLRKRPGVWVLIEIDIVRVKTEKKEKKKDKEKVAVVEPIADNTASAEASQDNEAERTRSNSLSQRMANLAKQSGGMAVNMMSPEAVSKSRSSSINATSTEDFERQKKQQQEEFERNMELQKREQEQELEKQKLEHERKQLEMEKQRQQQQQQQIALVEGQEARSYYVPNDSAAAYVRQQQQQQQAAAPPREDFSVHFTTLQQTILSLQTSVMGIHTKIDGLMTTKENNSNNEAGAATASLLQQMQLMQQQQQMAAMYNPNAMYGGGQMPGMGGMPGPMGGMNHMQSNQMQNNQMQNNQMQMQSQGQGQMQNQTSSGPVARGTELVNGVKALVEECAAHEKELVLFRQQGGSGSVGGGSGVNDQKLAKLEEKLETVMAKNDKLMDEKAELREKNSEILETASENSTKLARVQREVESLKRQQEDDAAELDSQKRSYMKRIAALNSEIETMTMDAASARSAAKNSNNSSDEDQAKIRQLEQDLKNVMNEKSNLQTEKNDLEEIMMSSNQEWQNRLDALSTEKSDAIRQLKDKSLDDMQEKEAAWEKESLRLKVALAEKERMVTDLEEVRDKTTQQLEDARNSGNSSDDANKEEFEKQLSTLKDQITELERGKATDKEQVSAAEKSLNEAQSDKDKALQRIAELEKQLKDQEDAIKEMGDKQNDRAPDELITDFVQDLFGRLHFAFVPPDTSSIDLDEAILSPNAVLKKCKKVLKQGATEFSSVPESGDRSTFVKLSR